MLRPWARALWIVPVSVIDSQLNLCIREYVLRHPPFPLDTSVLQVGLGSDNEEGLHTVYTVKFLEVVIASVEDVVSICLIRNFLHSPGIVNRSSGDVIEGWYLCLQVIEDVSLDTTFPLTELSPPEHRQTEGNRCGIKRIDLASELENVLCPLLPSLRHHVESELLKDAIVSVLISSSQCCLGNGLSP